MTSYGGRGKSALLILRTPFQAWLSEYVLSEEQVSCYEVLFFTTNDSPEDRHYFKKLAANARRAHYCHAKAGKSSLATQLTFFRQSAAWRRDGQYDITILSSLDASFVGSIARQQTGQIVTLDDGTANITPASIYHTGAFPWRDRLYRAALGCESLEHLKSRIARHYTLLPAFGNIVDRARVRTINSTLRRQATSTAVRTYFIGAPFEEALPETHVTRLREAAKGLPIDLYVPHPRERRCPLIDAPLLEKSGLIAEEAILKDAGTSQIHLFGWYSSVMFHLSGFAGKRTLLLPPHRNLETMKAMGVQAGCEVVLL